MYSVSNFTDNAKALRLLWFTLNNFKNIFLKTCIEKIMSHAKICSATTIGVHARAVHVEVDVALGLINFYIVGLPDTAIKESRQRISAALKNCGVKLPDRKITVNLAPADLKKEGTLFDVPITIGILQALGLVTLDESWISQTIMIGELSLDGTIRTVNGALAIAYDAHEMLQKKRIIVPKENALEAALINSLEVIGVSHLTELIAFLRNERTITPTKNTLELPSTVQDLDFSHVKGQQQAKRALQIAAAGHHNILFVGAPGAGKTMLAQRLPTIMPPLTTSEAIETSKIYSISGKLSRQVLYANRPFRAPHHSISQAGLVGGGTYPQPGEVSLAHHGILFLDELTEFKRGALEALRQPLEEHRVCIARANHSITFPAKFLLVGALNPCPCGFFGDQRRSCTCTPQDIQKYLQKLSGPLLDRIDLQIHIPSLAYDTMKQAPSNYTSADLVHPVQHARMRQEKRLGHGRTNSGMHSHEIECHCHLNPEAEHTIKIAFERLRLSMRGYHKILKIARTIADLHDEEDIQQPHIHEALMYRSLEHTLKTL